MRREGEIEARLAVWENARTEGIVTDDEMPELADLRYLLDRNKALEAALEESWLYDGYECQLCGASNIECVDGSTIEHDPDCIVLTLTEPVEAQQ